MFSAGSPVPEPSIGSWTPGEQVAAAVESELLVGFNPGVADQDVQNVLRGHGLSAIEKLYDARHAPTVHRVSVPAAAFEKVSAALQNNPHVRYAEPNHVAAALWQPSDPYYSYQWHLNNPQYGGIQMEPAWDSSTGQGAVVAVLDTGIAYENYQDSTGNYYRSPDLGGTRFVAGYDFINSDSHANDDHSHGTHVAGTIAQSTNNSTGVSGVAFNASIMPVKVLGKDGTGSYSAIANGIKWAADNGAKVINMSLGAPYASQTLQDALAYAYGKGVTIVAAAGNDGVSGVNYPAAYDNYVIAVSATRYDETLAGYSNYGSSIDLSAPGGDTSVDQNGDGFVDGVLQSTFDPNTKDTSAFGYYFFQGTSMASPHVAGVAALVVSRGVSDPAQVRQILQSTAEDKGAAGKDNYYGYGIVNAAAALPATGTTNTAPVAGNDSASTLEDTAVTIIVLGNDSDANGDPVTVSGVSPPANGAAVANADGTIRYTPKLNFRGTDSFSYTISDGRGGLDTATVSVVVASVNDAPVAVNDSANTVVGTPVTINVLANDWDSDADALTVVSFTAPVNGTVAKNADGTLSYTPKSGFSGSDSFSYTVADPAGAKATATVTVGVQAASSNTVFVSDLDGSITTQRNRWRAQVAIYIRDSSGRAVSGVTVSGTWSNGGSFTGTTDANGRLIAASGWLQKTAASITFAVDRVAHPDYNSTLNRDADGDSNGTRIVVHKDGTTLQSESSDEKERANRNQLARALAIEQLFSGDMLD